MDFQPARTKQQALERLCRGLGVPAMELSPGGTIPAEVFYLLARQLGLSPEGSMPHVGEAIARAAGLEWTVYCDSRHTKSGGGSTVTRLGMNRMLEALESSLSGLDATDSSAFGHDYVPATGGIVATVDAVSRDWDALDRATRRSR